MADHDDVRPAGGSLEVMPTLVHDPQPLEFERLLDRRRQLGQDLFDEVWEGVYHVNPAPHSRHADLESQLHAILRPHARQAGLGMRAQFNLGSEDDYRIPDSGLIRPGKDDVFLSTAALVIEIVSPNDRTWDKLGFYAARRVDELLIVDPQERRVHWLGLGADGEYRPLERSGVIELGAAELADQIDWPE